MRIFAKLQPWKRRFLMREQKHVPEDPDTADLRKVSAGSSSKGLVNRRYGAIAIGAQDLGAFSLGALAVGALSIGFLAIGRLAVGRARIKRLEIDELLVNNLSVRRLRVKEKLEGPGANV
jgi:hypothetical protein